MSSVKIKSIQHVTHDTLQIELEKPSDLSYVPGQATDVAINKPGWENEIRPFTFTSLPGQEGIEFTIKTYPSHRGVTNELLSLKPSDELIIGEVFGAIHYKGPGIFIAGGAGVTPFIAVFKDLKRKNEIHRNKLIFANKLEKDIILKDYFEELLGENFINVLSEENLPQYEHGYVTAELIKKQIDEETKYFYLCGPPPMIEAMERELASLGISADQIVKEDFS